MRKIISGGLLLLCSFGMLTGCIGYEKSGQLPQNLAKPSVQSQSYLISFFEGGASNKVIAPDGQALSEFMQQLTRNPPGYIRLWPRGNRLTEEDVVRLLLQSGLYRLSAVDIQPADDNPQDGEAILEIELTYYNYILGDCGADLDRRMVDNETWITPGFGCAVNHNRLVSLVRPGKSLAAGSLVPSSAQFEVKAIKTFQALPPRPFPPAKN